MTDAFFPPNLGTEADFSIWDKITLWLWKLPEVSVELTSEEGVKLSQIHPRLTLFCQLLCDLPSLKIIAVADEGGWSEPVFFMPEQICFGTYIWQNLQFYLFRALYLTIQRKQNANWHSPGEYPLTLSRQKALEQAGAILGELYQIFPDTEIWVTSLLQSLRQQALFEQELFLPWGRWISPLQTPRPSQPNRGKNILNQAPACQILQICSVSCENCGAGLIHFLN